MELNKIGSKGTKILCKALEKNTVIYIYIFFSNITRRFCAISYVDTERFRSQSKRNWRWWSKIFGSSVAEQDYS